MPHVTRRVFARAAGLPKPPRPARMWSQRVGRANMGAGCLSNQNGDLIPGPPLKGSGSVFIGAPPLDRDQD